jgi:hypothetical protein
MTDPRNIATMSDPDFLAERRQLRQTIETLTERLADLDDEFIKRASSAWSEAAK